jgi:cytosine/adenosine deaminase-related metal-dependent hydrolase
MEALSDEALDCLTTSNLVEILRSGCTTQVEMALSLRELRAYLRAADKLGVRGYPAAMVPDIGRVMPIWARTDEQTLLDSVPGTLNEIKANLEFGLSINRSQNDRIRPMMAVTVTGAHTVETLRELARAAQSLGNGVHLHVQADEASQRAFGKREVVLLDEAGVLDQVVFGAHLIGIDLEADLPILAGKKFTFVHCPSSGGAALHPGAQPYPEALAAGVNTAIGLDAHSNDLIENVKMSVVQGRAREHLLRGSSHVPVRRPSIWDAVRSATLGAAEGLNRDDLGRIAPGAKADLCTVDVAGLYVGTGNPAPAPLNNLLYASAHSVRNVMTDGVFQVLDGELLVEDESKLLERRRAIMSELHTQLEAEGWFIPRLN